MRTLLLAIRNLLRNRRRSLATLLAMAVGSTSILLFGGYSKNIQYSMETAYVRSGGHLQIQHRDFNNFGSGNPTAYGIADGARLLDAIRNDEVLGKLVLVATPTLQFGGIAGNYNAGVSRTILGVGIVADDHSAMRNWNGHDLPLVSPPLAMQGAAPDAAVVGTGVARVLQLCEALKIADCPQPQKEAPADGKAIPDDIAALSQLEAAPPKPTVRKAAKGKGKAIAEPAQPARSPRRIELLASSNRGTPNVASLDVIQAEGQGFKELDDVYVSLHLPQAQRLIYGSGPAKVTAIMLQLRHSGQIKAAQARLEAKLPEWSSRQPLAVLDLNTLNPFYVQTIALFDTIFGFIFVLIGGIVLFTVSNTMNTAVVERTVEIGTLRAIGLRQLGIRQLFVTEGVLLGLGGAVLGAVTALVISGFVNRLGLEWLPPGSAEPLPLILRVWGEPGMILGTTLGLIVIATLSAWWPAYRAARLNVVDALRHV
jgi:putative ABC transport system permease protein